MYPKYFTHMNAQRYQLFLSPKTRFLNFFRQLFIISGIDTHIAELTRKSNRHSLALKLIPPNYLYQLGTFRKCSLQNIKFSVDVSETNGHATYFGISDTAQSKLLSIMKEGMTVYDIGANIGTFALQFAGRVSKTGNVIGFEPGPYTYKQCLKNISLNHFNNILIFNEGLGESQSIAALYNVNPHNRGMQRLLADDNTDSYDKEIVQINTLDNKIETAQLPHPDVIKIDVEGYELKVLRGARQTLVKHKPVLFIELDDDNLKEQKNSAIEMISFLKELGYIIRKADTEEILDESFDYSSCHYDIICTCI
ncbi:MAG: FkbM family methyltransferase [Chitinophagaceae bacterium]|nr:FkbM family methyltransferase [Chitinophagaceae bacterium]